MTPRDADPTPVLNPLINFHGWEAFEGIALSDFAKYKLTCDCLVKELSMKSEKSSLSSISSCERNGKWQEGRHAGDAGAQSSKTHL